MPNTEATTALLLSPRELHGVQGLRGIAALMVVGDHLFDFHHGFFLPGCLTTGEAGVDLFFVISGFIMMYITPRAFSGWRDQGSFLLRRFCRIYPAYWAVALPLLLLWLINPAHIYHHPDRHDVFSTVLLTPSRTVPVVIVAWTLVYELYFYLVASAIFYFDRRQRLGLLALWFAVVAVAKLLHPAPIDHPWLRVLFSPLAFEFMLGMMVAPMLQSTGRRIPGAMAGLLIAVAAATGLIAGVRHGQFNIFAPDVTRVLCYGVPAFVILFLVLKMERQRTWPWVGGTDWIGNRSYSIYLLHVPLLIAIQTFVAHEMMFFNQLGAILVFVALVGLAVLPIEVFYRLIEIPSHALARRLAQSVHRLVLPSGWKLHVEGRRYT